MSSGLCGLGIQEQLVWVVLALGSLMRSQSKTSSFSSLVLWEDSKCSISGDEGAAFPARVSLIVDTQELDFLHDGPGEPSAHVSKGEIQVTAVFPFMT